MNPLRGLFICFLVVGLSSCVTQPKNSTNIQTKEACQKACVTHFEGCKKKCDTNCQTCSINTYRSASSHYAQYINEKKIEGALIARDLNSYRDPLQCRKISCDCVADLNLCHQTCTGLIHKQLRVVPKCS